MATEIYSSKVGRRWFSLTAFDEEASNPKPIANVEASYSTHTRWLGVGAGWKTENAWTITGLGARKYRQQIIDHLEGKYFNGDNSETN